MKSAAQERLRVRALHTLQGENLDVYAFFLRGRDVTRVADISRVARSETETLKGFQRPVIKEHVRSIVEYLNQGSVLFPNAIILALSPDVNFVASRGSKPDNDDGVSQAGTLTLPIRGEGHRAAWVVDGQQRSLALAQARDGEVAVPVVGFVSNSLAVQRQQFILVNKVRPLPTRLINELLPETGSVDLPRELTARRMPAELCHALNRDPESPFYGLIRRPSDPEGAKGVIIDTAVIEMIRHRLQNSLGALVRFKASGPEAADVDGMYRRLVDFWSAVKRVFPDAWGVEPRRSRLMHAVGIHAMGVLMDLIYAKLSASGATGTAIEAALCKVAADCRWTQGIWPHLGVAWNELQNTPSDIKRLQESLVRAFTTADAR